MTFLTTAAEADTIEMYAASFQIMASLTFTPCAAAIGVTAGAAAIEDTHQR
jgi:hypothetical protein